MRLEYRALQEHMIADIGVAIRYPLRFTLAFSKFGSPYFEPVRFRIRSARQFRRDLAELGMRRDNEASRTPMATIRRFIREAVESSAKGAGIRRIQFILGERYHLQVSRCSILVLVSLGFRVLQTSSLALPFYARNGSSVTAFFRFGIVIHRIIVANEMRRLNPSAPVWRVTNRLRKRTWQSPGYSAALSRCFLICSYL